MMLTTCAAALMSLFISMSDRRVVSLDAERILQRKWAMFLAKANPTPANTFRATNLIVDQLVTNDTETFFSCGSAALDNIDPWLGGPHNSRVEIDMTANHCTINGIVAGNEGDLLWLWNGGGGGSGASAQNPLIVTINNAASSIPIDNIYVADGKNVSIPNNDGILLIYDGGFGWTGFGTATSSIRATEFSYEFAATPAALNSGSSYNNYNPWAGTTTSSFVKLDVSGSGTATLTGLTAAGAPNSDGRVVVIKNVSGSGTVAFTCQDGASIPDDQFQCPNGSAFSISHGEAASLLYDDTVNFYSVIALGKAPSSGGGGSGTVTSVGSGSGIAGGPITTTGNLAIDPTYTQRRIINSCSNPNGLLSVNQDGSVSCTTGVGTVSSVGSGSGISGGPITSTGNLAIDPTYTQRRVGSACTLPNSMIGINQDGTVSCTGTNATMSIANATQVAGVNLSTTGTGQIDWIAATPQNTSTRVYDSFVDQVIEKATGGGLLLNPGIDIIGTTGTLAASNGTITFSSTAGDTLSGGALSQSLGNGLSGVSAGAGFRFAAPVTNTQRVLRIWTSHSNSTLGCTAHLQDASVTDKSTTPTVATTAVEEIATVTVLAGSVNTYVVVSCAVTATSGTAVIKWYAELLSAT